MGFDELYQAYFKDVFLYMKSFSVDDHTAEEITQETFVKALRSISQFDGRKDFRAWLFTIARNTWFTWSKREKRLIQCPDALQAESIPDPSPDVTEKIVNEEKALLIHIFLHNMKEPYKEVFSLRVPMCCLSATAAITAAFRPMKGRKTSRMFPLLQPEQCSIRWDEA